MKTFEEIARLWAEDKKHFVKKSTLSVYILQLENHILPEWRHETDFQGREREVQKYVLDKIDSGLSQKTVKDIMIVLKMILRFGSKYYNYPFQEFDIKYPTEHTKYEVEVMRLEDQKRLMDYIVNHFSFKNLGIYMCLCTGMRIGEICALKWSDVDTDNSVIRIKRTLQRIYLVDGEEKYTEIIINSPKTKNSLREIPMTRELIRLIKPLKKILNDDFYVLTNDERPTEPRTYRSYYKKLFNSLGLQPMKFHGLRHTFATRCIESKCDPKTLSVLLGHANVTTTFNLYVHPNEQQKLTALKQMFKRL